MGKQPEIGCVDGKGMVAGVACVKPGTHREPHPDLAWDIVERCWHKGLLMFMPVGFGGATVKISPPLIISDEALEESLQVFEETFAEVAAEHKLEPAAR